MYYPLSEITQNLYTFGTEYVDLVTGQSYVGDYFSTTDGKYFTGKTVSSSSREIIKVSQRNDSYLVSNPSSYYPNPEDKDYEAGYITRYVVKRVNSGAETIREVSKEQYEKLIPNPLYAQAEFKWLIAGNYYDNLSNLSYPIYGIIHTNRRTIFDLETKILEISQVFINYTEFAK